MAPDVPRDLPPIPPDLPEVARRLTREYLPHPPAPRAAREPLDALIRTILGQQNTGRVAQRQFAALRGTYPAWEAALLDGPDGIKETLKGAGGGLSRVKAGYIHGILAALDERHSVLSLAHLHALNDPEARLELESLPGVGPRTASLILLFDLIRPAMPVDANIERLVKRLAWVPERWNAHQMERWLDQAMPRDWAARQALHIAGVRHGRDTCRPRRPACDTCVLSDLCPSAGLLGPADRPDRK